MTRRLDREASVSVPIVDRQTDPTFVASVLEEVWDMVKRVRPRSGPRAQSYTVSWPPLDQEVEILVRRVVRLNTNPVDAR